MNCTSCRTHDCYLNGKNCLGKDEKEVIDLYTEEEVRIMQSASRTESENYLKMTRLEESLYFVRDMGYTKVGIAFCIGLAKEAELCAAYFRNNGIKVESLCCKNCGVDKDLLELSKIKKGSKEVMCNPKMQAENMNRAKTDINFIVGLCVGHDVIFTKNSNAPVSSLITKDRVLANNPAGVVYSRYWKRKLGILEEDQV